MTDYLRLPADQQRAQIEAALINLESQLLNLRIDRAVNSHYPQADLTALDAAIASADAGRADLVEMLDALPTPTPPSSPETQTLADIAGVQPVIDQKN